MRRPLHVPLVSFVIFATQPKDFMSTSPGAYPTALGQLVDGVTSEDKMVEPFLSCQLLHERPLKLASRSGSVQMQQRSVRVEGTHIRLNRSQWLFHTELECIELIVISTCGQELRRSTCFDDLALVEYENQVGTLNGRETMCAHERCAPGHESL